MKELSIQEKAKRYDEALKQIKECTPDENGFVTIYPDEIFPELKESEDEKIRKEIIKLVKFFYGSSLVCKHTISKDKMVAWLEKQGEQKPANKVEPKFKIGDWIIYNRNDHSRKVMRIYDIRDNRYYFNDNIHFSWSVKECDEKSHLWTIQDAKNGDILVNGTILIIVDHLDTFENRPIIYSWYFADSEKFHGIGPSEPDRWEVKGFIPATKEQRDILFAKMKEVGYEWDADEKVVNMEKGK